MNLQLSYIEPNRLVGGLSGSRVTPVNAAIVARQTAFTVRGASAPRQIEDEPCSN